MFQTTASEPGKETVTELPLGNSSRGKRENVKKVLTRKTLVNLRN